MSDTADTAIVPANAPQLPAAVAEMIPFTHHADWIALGDDERARVQELLTVFTLVSMAPQGVTNALQEQAFANKGRKGWSFANLRTLYYAWIAAERDWRALARAYSHETSLPADFVKHLRTLTLQEHRSRKQAIEKIRAAWRDGESVPGYGTWRQWFAATWPDRDVPRSFAGDYPKGWCQSNLYRYMPPPAQQEQATRGYTAAHKHLPHVVRDTSKLRPLEMIVFDDFKTDIRVAAYNPVLKRWEIVPCVGLLAMDVATRKILTFLLKPRFTLPRSRSDRDTSALTAEELAKDEATRRIAITRADMRDMLRVIFQDYGVPADYAVTLLVENAAAAIGADLEAALALWFHGQVRVSRTSMLEHRTLTNGFVEGGGRPWLKGWIESTFNITHNMAGSLPGQTGSDEQVNAPGDLAARIAYSLAVLDGLTPEQAAEVKLPVLTLAQAMAAYGHIFNLLDQRGEHSEHKMQGFDRVQFYRLGPGQELKPLTQLALTAGEDCSQIEIKDRVQSPRERWAALRAKEKPCTKVPEFVTALLTYTPKKCEIRNRKVVFIHNKTDFVYLDTEGCTKELAEGTKLLGYFDESAPDGLFLTDLKGRGIGVLAHNSRANIKDPEQIGRAAALMQQFFAKQVQGPVRELLAPVNDQLALDRAHNTTLRAQWDADAKRSALSATLADDKVTTTPEQRFAAATETAAGLADHATKQAKLAEEARSTAKDHATVAKLVKQYAQEESSAGYI